MLCRGHLLDRRGRQYMSAEEILSEVQDIMRDVFDLDDLEVNPTTSAEDVEEWDSLSHVRLIVAIERKFKFKFTNSEIDSLKNVGDLVRVIQSKVN
jgi:acyl carrier protein